MDQVHEADAKRPGAPLWRALTLEGRISRRAGMLGVGGAATLAALALGWPWLVAAGLAPLILAFAPCAAMCALGLCAHNMGGKQMGDKEK